VPTAKKEVTKKGRGHAIVSDEVRSHADDPFFVKKNAAAKEALSKTDLSTLLEKAAHHK
jgi:hypothetical protein